MTVDYAAARELFLAALEQPPDEREAFLRSRCADDAALLAEVRSLLEFHDEEAAGDRAALPPLPAGERYADRYRILRRIGRGGMGDVYHAHDEVLDEPVALKRLAVRDPGFREALLNEVRLARRVTHPRICRVYDLGEWRGERFITMEYIEGEDLGKLLRRVGRLSSERVAEIARELCVGLAAAHAKGVLHRDLKPANILVDPEGHVHLTDFGIAARAGARGAAAMTGSPSYMAPEQLVPGGSSSERSDIYALGLVLHEMLTGKPVFPGPGLTDVLVSRKEVVPPPSAVVSEVHSELDRAVLRSLSADPRERPGSALELAGLLPGGDALLAAVEANATPSPELVARAASASKLAAPSRPIVKLVALVLLLVGTFILADALPFAPIGVDATHPAVSVDRAVRLLRELGYEAGAGATSFQGYVQDPTAPAGEASLLFWYREDREPYRTSFQREVLDPTAALTLYVTTTGLEPDRLITVFDEAGGLVYFQGPPGAPGDRTESAPTDWTRLLATVGLDAADLTPIDLELPPMFATDRGAWARADPHEAVREQRIDAAAVDGRLVYFSRGPRADAPMGQSGAAPGTAGAVFINLVLLPAFFVVAIVFLVRNVRTRRFDGSGTLKLVAVVGALALAEWLLLADHIFHPLSDYSGTLTSSFTSVPFACFSVALFYLALEPAVRHAWPHTLIAWTQALHGHRRSAVVGQSVLIGTIAGSLCALIFVVDLAIPGSVLGLEPVSIDHAPRLLAVLGVRETTSVLLGNAYDAIGRGVVLLFVFTMLRSWLRRPALATTAFVALVAVLESGVGLHHGFSVITLGVPIGIVTAWVFARAGLLAGVVAGFVYLSIRFTPITLEGDAWWAWSGFTTASAVVLLGVVGAWMSTRSPVGRALTVPTGARG